jgi:quinolinate synthase
MEIEKVQRILELKEEKDALILAHNYQRPEVQLVADRLDDSLALAREATKTDASIIVFCGVDFMAETAKALNPQKKVLLPDPKATCPLAGMVDLEELISFKSSHPSWEVVSYVNTTAQTKAQSDICCTSANCVKVVASLSAKNVIFLPDQNLGRWTKRGVKDKEITLWPGYCYVHDRMISLEKLKRVKSDHPDALVMAHPECRLELLESADVVASTGGMVKFARESSAREFIVATEEGLCSRLRRENPDKLFWDFSEAVCMDMKKTTLDKVLRCLEYERYEIQMEDEVLERARAPIERMVEIG